MSLRSRIPLAAVLLGTGLLVAPGTAPASAGPIVQDLQVSATSGAAGDVITVASASCTLPSDADGFRALQVRLIAGAAPDEVLAGAGTGEGSATFVVPAWIDPDAPATIEASCTEVTFPDVGDPVAVTTGYDPVAFDVVADPSAPVQSRTFSRTTIRVGQGIHVGITGCDLEGAQVVEVDAIAGNDPSGRTLGDLGFLGYGPLDGTSGTADLIAINGSAGVSLSSTDGGPPTVDEVDETPTDLPEGTYTAFPICVADDGNVLVYEPQAVEVDGTSPVGDVDLEVPAGTREATMAGGSCDQGTVTARIELESAQSIVDGFDESFSDAEMAVAPPTQVAEQLAARRAPRRTTVRRTGVVRRPTAARFTRAPVDLEVTVAPGADGSWSTSATATFDEGVVYGLASCGDTFAEGFTYDPQVAAVHVKATTTTTEATTTTTASAPPANAVSGTPTFAG
ncbi:MAG: hypothetical protein U0P45_11285 [Acidimicrobiales bacterium]